jgi:ABC-type sugar transport system permease subunit
VRRFPWLRSRTLKGIGYVAPTAVVVGVFFIVPLVLVFWMSVNRWPLLGSPEVNEEIPTTSPPTNVEPPPSGRQLQRHPRQPAVQGQRHVHAEVHGDRHRRALGVRDGAGR